MVVPLFVLLGIEGLACIFDSQYDSALKKWRSQSGYRSLE
jgi:hypothetical protein